MSVGTLAYKFLLGTALVFAMYLGTAFAFSMLPVSFEAFSWLPPFVGLGIAYLTVWRD